MGDEAGTAVVNRVEEENPGMEQGMRAGIPNDSLLGAK
jgi:hypothetical protein